MKGKSTFFTSIHRKPVPIVTCWFAFVKNLLQDYWSSMFFAKFKEESSVQPNSNEFMEHVAAWDYSPRLSSVHGSDDPFHQEHPQKVLRS